MHTYVHIHTYKHTHMYIHKYIKINKTYIHIRHRKKNVPQIKNKQNENIYLWSFSLGNDNIFTPMPSNCIHQNNCEAFAAPPKKKKIPVTLSTPKKKRNRFVSYKSL